MICLKDVSTVCRTNLSGLWNECAKFCGSCVIMGLVGLVQLCHHVFMGIFVGPKYNLVGISWIQNIFSWVFHDSKIFCHGYFIGPKIQNFSHRYFVGPKFFLWVFCGSKIFSCGYFMGTNFFS